MSHDHSKHAPGAHDHAHDHKHDHDHQHDHKKDHTHEHKAGHDHGHKHDHAHGHDHDHDHGGLMHVHGGGNATRLMIALFFTTAFMVVEIVAGFMASSLALIADAGHMLTDAAALGMAYAAIRISARPADHRRSYGYDRLQVLAAFVNGLSLLVISIWILIEACTRLFAPVQVLAGPMLAVAIGGFVVNLLMFAVLHGGDRENLNMSGAIAHVLGDLAGSVAAILAAVVILYTGWMPADPILSALVALMILRTGWKLARVSAHVLLEGAPEGFDAAALVQNLPAEIAGVSDIHHIHVWMLTPEKPMMTLHARIDDSADADQLTREIGAWLKSKHGIIHATIQIERGGCTEPHH